MQPQPLTTSLQIDLEMGLVEAFLGHDRAPFVGHRSGVLEVGRGGDLYGRFVWERLGAEICKRICMGDLYRYYYETELVWN